MKEKYSKIAKQDKNYLKLLKEPYGLSQELLALRLVYPKSLVLSIGCGAGREVKYLVQKIKCKVTAIDYDEEMIKNSKTIEPKAEYLCIDALNFSRKNTYDYIVCLWNTINFLDKNERKKLIELSYKNLKKDGKLILTTAHLFNCWRFPLHNLKHFSSYYPFPKEINWWFKDTNFKIEKIRIGNSLLVVAQKTL